MNKTVTTELNSMDNHSAEISQNAKGDISFSVKAYGSNPAVATKRAISMFSEINRWKKAEQEQGSSDQP